MPWDHISPIHGHQMEADVDCSGLQFPAKFVVTGDFDADGRTELAVAPDAVNSRGNDFWVMKYNVAGGAWQHMSPIPNHPMEADFDCSGREFAAKFAVVADFDGDGADEIAIAPDAGGSQGNDLWVMKFNRETWAWQHMAPIPNHPMNADIDCSGVQFAAKFAVAGDFDGDGREELLIAPDTDTSRGNDLWVMKYVGSFPRGTWQHMAPIPNHPMDADIDCSGREFAAKFAVVADFDRDGHAEVAVALDAGGSTGNDFWVMKFVGEFPGGSWRHMAPIPNHPVDADIDCSGREFPAKFALAADFDSDLRAELVVAPDADVSRGNDLWVMKYVGQFPTGTWRHMAPIPNHPMNADIDCSGREFPAKFAVTADFDADLRAELVVVPDTGTSRGNDLWVMKYVGSFPTGTWQHMAPIPNHPMNADIDCSGTQFAARLAVAADFDRDGADELVVAPDADNSAGNDLWVMKFFGEFPGGSFGHMTPIPNHPTDADIDLASVGVPVKSLHVGVYDGDAPELMATPNVATSRGNDFWVVGFPVQNVFVVDMIPNALSGENGQDSEPNLGVNPASPQQIAGSAFTSNPAGGLTAPIFVSTNGGTTWVLNNIVPSAGSTSDITVRFASLTNNLYAGILRRPGPAFTRDIVRTNAFTGPTAMTLLISRPNVDQPYIEAISVQPAAGAAPVDIVFMGNEDRALLRNVGGTGQTATIDLSQNAGTAPPAGFGIARLEQRTGTVRNGPPVRPAVHPDGTVYAVFYRWTANTIPVGGAFTFTADVVVVRDDNFGAGAAPFQNLLDPNDHVAGVRVVTGRTVPFNSNSQPAFGQERFVGSNISIAIDPRDSDVVYVAWADRVSTNDYTLHVRRSSDRGATWSDDVRTVTNATNPALAINSTGKLAFLYQALAGPATGLTWDTHVELTTDDWRSPATDLLLSTAPSATPAVSFLPYLGDYVHVMAVGRVFYGIFSANNTPKLANFPSGVVYQRNANFNTQTLLNIDNATPVPVSIDPFFFSVTPRPRG